MIVLLETIHREAVEILEAVDEVVLVEEPPELDASLPFDEIRAVVTRGLGQVGANMMQQMPKLEVVARCGAGLDNIDTESAAKMGITVVHAPGLTSHGVAEHAIMLMLSLARQLVCLDNAVKADNWQRRNGYEGTEMRGKRMGIIGLGGIGSRIAQLGQAFGMDVAYSSRGEKSVPYRYLDLDELLGTSDVIMVCTALTPGTLGMIGTEQIEMMKPSALLINTARGPLVDHGALAKGLAAGSLAGYASDVWAPEPPEPGDKLVANPRVLVTPHVAGLTDVTYREICVRPATTVAAILSGEAPNQRYVYAS